MSKHKIFAAGLMLALYAGTTVHAQVSVDVAKISCNQFNLYKITDPRNIAIWLSGFYNSKRNNTVIDTQVFSENYEKLRSYCVSNPDTPVMQAAETLFGVRR
jgi:hypothetical protein